MTVLSRAVAPGRSLVLLPLGRRGRGSNVLLGTMAPAARRIAGVPADPKSKFSHLDTFAHRHIGPSAAEQKEMLAAVGAKDLEAFIDSVIPPHIRRKGDMPGLSVETRSESETVAWIRAMADKNKAVRNFLGMGYHGTIVPNAVLRNVLENPAWYTAYTPYQAEIAQGRLESQLNFQTVVTELTGMELSNASLLDEATAGAEAMTMVARCTGAGKKVFFVADTVHPQTIAVIQGRAALQGLEVEVGDWTKADFSRADLSGAMVQYPDTRGAFHDYSKVAETLHAAKSMLVVGTDPLALCLAKKPADFGADMVVGTLQRFGVPMGYGGPAAAFLACSKSHVRKVPGRIIGVSKDRLGQPAYRMTLQTREQHIRLEKATSNICTAQALLANMSAFYAIYHGPEGLRQIAARVHGLTRMCAAGLTNGGLKVSNADNFFDTLTVEVGPKAKDVLAKLLREHGISARQVSATELGFAFDETHGEADVRAVLDGLASVHGKDSKTLLAKVDVAVDGSLPAPAFQRQDGFMTQKVFHENRTETELMRYMYRLQQRDLSLTTSMISLGSCTMKLNSVSSLLPVSWPEFANVHPMAPRETTEGYNELLKGLQEMLCSITNFDACSLQPASGAAGEFAGLQAIRDYHKSIGEGHRNVCIIPKSAHGTNPASAAMAGMNIKWIDDSAGMDMQKLESLISQHAKDLSCLMITYPSTHGVFDPNISRICELVHGAGGNVYMDGANMNAQVGFTAPGFIGADVCHLNLHKTFSIPHGGGGPGMGPICVRKHLAKFLPGHPVVPVDPVEGSDLHVADVPNGAVVQGAPYGQAGIACIPWMYIAMLGSRGLRDSTAHAILNANYMMSRLRDHFPILTKGYNNRCSHEFIIDLSSLRGTTGVTEEDIAKRLQDYGFHAPTMSWPLHSSLMMEPTESENKQELDRFCDALIAIRGEIRKIENKEWPLDDNPLKMAPHTQQEVCATEWTHPYSRELAAFPAPWVQERGKHWPATARIDNSYGDKYITATRQE